MVRIHVGMEVDDDGLAMAWVQEYFGCTSHGTSQEEALRLLPDALRSFWSWLKTHGEMDVPSDEEEIVIEQVETCHVGSHLVDGDSEGFFSFDRPPAMPADFERALRFMACARSDVLALAQELGEEGLHSAVGRSGRSVGATLGHLAFADLWYAQRSGRIMDGAWEEHLLNRLREVSLEWLQHSLEEGGGSLATVPPDVWSGTGRGEIWTLPKALRRYVWHDLVHLRAMQRSLRSEEAVASLISGRAPERAPARSTAITDLSIEVQRLDGGTLRLRHALEMAQAFFRLDPSANGPKSYDTAVANAARDRITSEDVHAINVTMAAHAARRVWEPLYADTAPQWLAELDQAWHLFELSDDAWRDLEVEQKIAGALDAMIGIGRRLSVVTKVLHMKRPELIPVCDSLVLQQLGAQTSLDHDPAAGAALIGHLRREGRRILPTLLEIQERLERDGYHRSLVRIFEALIWQSHRDVWYQKLAPLIDEWLSQRMEG